MDRTGHRHGRLESLVAQIKTVPAAEGDGVYLPGEPELNMEGARRRDGIPVTDEQARQLDALAREAGVAPAAWRFD